MKRLIRWPLFCTRCGSRDHFAEDCKLPTLGMCQIEREMKAISKAERRAVLLMLAVVVIGLSVIGFLERAPS